MPSGTASGGNSFACVTKSSESSTAPATRTGSGLGTEMIWWQRHWQSSGLPEVFPPCSVCAPMPCAQHSPKTSCAYPVSTHRETMATNKLERRNFNPREG